MSTRRILLLALGGVAVLVSLAFLATGGLALWLDSTRDDDGFFTTSTEPFETTAFALESEDLDVASDAPGWLFGSGRFGDIRLRGDSLDPSRAIFLGIGDREAVASYLDGVAVDVVTDVNFEPFEPTYRREAGARAPGAPGDQAFWAASAQGRGPQSLRWTVEPGEWTVVVMNADGARGVGVDLQLGANIGFVRGIGIGFLAVGALLLLGGAVMIWLGASRDPSETEPTDAMGGIGLTDATRDGSGESGGDDPGRGGNPSPGP